MEKIKNLVAAAKANKKALAVKSLTIGGTALGAFALGAALSKSETDIEITSLKTLETQPDGTTIETEIETATLDS